LLVAKRIALRLNFLRGRCRCNHRPVTSFFALLLADGFGALGCCFVVCFATCVCRLILFFCRLICRRDLRRDVPFGFICGIRTLRLFVCVARTVKDVFYAAAASAALAGKRNIFAAFLACARVHKRKTCGMTVVECVARRLTFVEKTHV
jgi:hypothetical protein